MKTDTADRQYRSDTVGTKHRMGIAEGAEAFVMDILTKMYPDPELAIVREYSTNAKDSHTQAGQDRPIEMTLPTQFLPTLTIRDYGIGLDEQGIIELYSQYGASSKRDSNEVQGMLGIGCKSALAYTDQFTIIGFKEGVKTTVLISRDEDGAGSQQIVGVEHGDYEDGVEVTIPTKRDNNLYDKADDFFRFWPEGSIVIRAGENDTFRAPRRLAQDTRADEDGDEDRNIWLDDRTLLTNEVEQDLVVMGFVAYPLVPGDDPLFQAPATGRHYMNGHYVHRRAYNAVCFVDIGDVSFAPSRESLMASPRTKAKLDELRKHVAATFDASVRKQIADAPTAKDAQQALITGKAAGFTDSPHATWNGRDVVLELTRGKKDPSSGQIKQTYGVDDWSAEDCLKYSYLYSNLTSYTRQQGERNGRLNLTNSVTIFTGFTGKWLTPVKRAKLDKWESDNGRSVGIAVFIDKLNKDEKFWTNGWPTEDWADVEAVVLPTATGADGGTVRLKGSYPVSVNSHGNFVDTPAHKIDQTKPIYYAHGNSWAVRQDNALRTGAISLTGASLVALSKNRVEKFKRDFPTAVELTDAAKEAAKTWAAKIDSDQAKAHAVRANRASYTLQALKDEDFDDPTLNTLIRLANTKHDEYEAGLAKFQRYIETGTTPADSVRKLLDELSVKYPLAPWDHYVVPKGKAKEHVVLYINAAIAARKERP